MIKITADSACDFSPEITTIMDITLLPISILIADKAFRDGVDITPADIFRLVDKEGKTCKTAAANVYEYEWFFAGFSSRYEAVIHICLGSGFSSCYQNATLAAENFKNVHVIDSKNLSSGTGHVVFEAARMAREGSGVQDICRNLEDLIPRVDASFVIDRLDYLHKGGRCSGLERLGAKVLQIKPCIEVINGKMKIGKKYRGNFERCLSFYVQDRLSNDDDIDFSRVFITHPMCTKQIVDMVKKLLYDNTRFKEIIETPAGCTVSCHCGPDTLGILYKRKTRK